MLSIDRLTKQATTTVVFVALATCMSGCSTSSDRPSEASDTDPSKQSESRDSENNEDSSDRLACEAGAVCDEYTVCNGEGVCEPGCIVDGSFRAMGTVNPSNPCEACEYPNQIGWSARSVAACYPEGGSLCDSSEGCTTLHDVSAGQGTCAISSNGGLMCWGVAEQSWTDANRQTPVAGLESDVVAVSYGDSSYCAITSSGAVWCGGTWVFGSPDNCMEDIDSCNEYRNESGLPIEVMAAGSDIVAVSPNTATHALTSGGGVVCWGFGCNGTNYNIREPVPVPGLESGIVDVSSGALHACALTESGAVLCWGHNCGEVSTNGSMAGTRAEPEVVLGLESGVVAISAGGRHTCAIKSTGAVVCWGYNDLGQLGDGTNEYCMAVPVAVPGLESGVAQISANGLYTCALTTESAVVCWQGGYVWDYTWDPLSGGATTGLVSVPGLESGVTAVSLGHSHICAEVSGHGVICMGCGDEGQVGNGRGRMCKID